MGWETYATCEINPFGQRVLNYYWPDAYHHLDIHDFTFKKLNEELKKRFGQYWRSDEIILTGGFPCQPYSQAGKRLGKEDDRHLWPEMLRTIREIKPTWVVGENVYGLVNWSGGLVFEEVQTDLEAEGYEVQPVIIPACGVNAPHKRERIWFVAYRNGKSWEQEINGRKEYRQEREQIRDINNTNGRESNVTNFWSNGRKSNNESKERQQYDGRGPTWCKSGSFDGGESIAYPKSKRGGGLSEREIESNPIIGINGKNEIITNSISERLEGGIRTQKSIRPKQRSKKAVTNTISGGRIQNNIKFSSEQFKQTCAGWDKFPTQSPICSRNDGISSRLDGITFPKWRSESIKAYGNAIVPQVALEIFKVIVEYENNN